MSSRHPVRHREYHVYTPSLTEPLLCIMQAESAEAGFVSTPDCWKFNISCKVKVLDSTFHALKPKENQAAVQASSGITRDRNFSLSFFLFFQHDVNGGRDLKMSEMSKH